MLATQDEDGNMIVGDGAGEIVLIEGIIREEIFKEKIS